MIPVQHCPSDPLPEKVSVTSRRHRAAVSGGGTGRSASGINGTITGCVTTYGINYGDSYNPGEPFGYSTDGSNAKYGAIAARPLTNVATAISGLAMRWGAVPLIAASELLR